MAASIARAESPARSSVAVSHEAPAGHSSSGEELGLHQLLDTLAAAAYTTDANGLITYFNQRAERLWGRRPALHDTEDRYCGSFKLLAFDGSPVPHEQCWMALALRLDQEFQGHEIVIERPDGGRTMVLAHAKPFHDQLGNVAGAVNILVDITDRRRNEQVLRESERDLRQMLDALPVAIYTTDREGRLTYFNAAAMEFAGRTPELGTDQWCVTWKLFHANGDPMPHSTCPMAVALKEGRAVPGVEAIAERPDSTRKWFTPFPSPLRDSQGRIVGGINMLLDITERKDAEAARCQGQGRQ